MPCESIWRYVKDIHWKPPLLRLFSLRSRNSLTVIFLYFYCSFLCFYSILRSVSLTFIANKLKESKWEMEGERERESRAYYYSSTISNGMRALAKIFISLCFFYYFYSFPLFNCFFAFFLLLLCFLLCKCFSTLFFASLFTFNSLLLSLKKGQKSILSEKSIQITTTTKSIINER